MYKKGFIFIPKIHFKKKIFFISGKDVRKENLNFYTNTTKRNEKDNKFYIDNDYAAYLHQYFSYGS